MPPCALCGHNPHMPLSWSEFVKQRQWTKLQLFPNAGATKTVMVCSHIWWTEQIALAIYNAGYNVLFAPPFYLMYTDELSWQQFDSHWKDTRETLRRHDVSLIVGGNTCAILVNPKTGELVHHQAGADGRTIPIVNWWWDELRTRPPFAREGISPDDFLKILADPHTVNAIWDVDVKEELEAQFSLRNLFHLPLATLPEFWPHGFIPMEERPLAACFLGNCHFDATWAATDQDPLLDWARDAAARKASDTRIPMKQCISAATLKSGGIPKNSKYLTGTDAWTEFARPWELLNAAWMHMTRNQMVIAIANHLKGKLALIGKGWNALGLRANMEHAGEKSGVIYGQSQLSLNLFGGCVHGGLPLRPFDIATSSGLILTHNQRELPDHFTPGSECVAFNSESDLIAKIDHIRSHPETYNNICKAGRQRVLSCHTWGHRIEVLTDELARRGLS